MKSLYIIAPYAPRNEQSISSNVMVAVKATAKIIDLDTEEYFAPLVIHAVGWMVSSHVDKSEDYWYKYTMSHLERCDAAIIVADIETSKGSQQEISACEDLGIPWTQLLNTSPSELKQALTYLKWKLEGGKRES